MRSMRGEEAAVKYFSLVCYLLLFRQGEPITAEKTFLPLKKLKKNKNEKTFLLLLLRRKPETQPK